MNREIIIHSGDNLPDRPGGYLPELITQAGERAGAKFVEFFLNQIANTNTRKTYGRAVYQFFAWCADRDLTIETITPLVAGTYIRTHPASDATVKQHLAALRTLYDWFVTEQVAE